MSPGSPTGSGPITPADIEQRFRDLQDEVETIESDARDHLGIAVAVVAVAVVVAAFLLGRRRGKKRRTVVEVRRI